MLVAAAYAITGSIASRWDFTQYEQDRMRRVALGFSALLAHAKVTPEKTAALSGQGDHFRVELPRQYHVERIVNDINHPRNMR